MQNSIPKRQQFIITLKFTFSPHENAYKKWHFFFHMRLLCAFAYIEMAIDVYMAKTTSSHSNASLSVHATHICAERCTWQHINSNIHLIALTTFFFSCRFSFCLRIFFFFLLLSFSLLLHLLCLFIIHFCLGSSYVFKCGGSNHWA